MNIGGSSNQQQTLYPMGAMSSVSGTESVFTLESKAMVLYTGKVPWPL